MVGGLVEGAPDTDEAGAGAVTSFEADVTRAEEAVTEAAEEEVEEPFPDTVVAFVGVGGREELADDI